MESLIYLSMIIVFQKFFNVGKCFFKVHTENYTHMNTHTELEILREVEQEYKFVLTLDKLNNQIFWCWFNSSTNINQALAMYSALLDAVGHITDAMLCYN